MRNKRLILLLPLVLLFAGLTRATAENACHIVNDLRGNISFLESVPVEVGRLTPTGALYYVRDHLGSVRAVVDGSAAGTAATPPTNILAVGDYSPYGERSQSAAASLLTLAQAPAGTTLRHRFTAQEDQWPDFIVPYTDFGARQYNVNLRRWMVPDPKGEAYYDISPYVYCAGDPVRYVDDGGRDIVLAGKNNSSVTVQTRLLDRTIDISRLGIDWGGQYALDGEKTISAALDVAGVFDPSGISDAANASLQFSSGDYFNGTLSAISVIPAVGDLAKIPRIGKDVRILNDAISAFTEGGKWTKNLRTNMIKAFGEAPEGMHAHHILPKKFEKQFKEAGIQNISDPKYGVWMDSHHHLSKAKEYNAKWEKYLSKKPSKSEIEEYAKTVMEEVYGK